MASASIEAPLQGNGEIIEIRGWLDNSRRRIRGVKKSTGEPVVLAFYNFPTVKAKQIDLLDRHNKKDNIPNKKSEYRKQKVQEAVLQMPAINEATGSCIYKLYYGDRYIIHRASNSLQGSLFNIIRAYSYFKGYANVHKETSDKKDYYFAFYNFIRRNKGKELRVEVLFESDNFYDLLVFEHRTLEENFSYKKCLNANISSYIPTRSKLIPQDMLDRYKKDFAIED